MGTTTRYPLGIDIGGSGIKGAPVDLTAGQFAADRHRLATPEPSTPQAVMAIVAQLAEQFADLTGEGPVGVTIPGVVTHGVVRSAANIDDSWLDFDAQQALSDTLGRPVTVLNDADAAGVAELHYGAARGVDGTVLVATLGTGIGTVVLVNGVLVPNTELGHLEIDGVDAETRASAAARERENLSWEQWAARLQRYFSHVENLLWPDLIVIGGGVSKHADKYLARLALRTAIVPAKLLNAAGIVGAARYAADQA